MSERESARTSERGERREPVLGADRPVHMMGIGGAGMSALAEILLAEGREVSGCDLKAGPVLDRLEALGATVHVGHDPEHLDAAAVVVVSSAIQATDPELAAARERDQPVLLRAELLGALMDRARGIGVAGTHGKSTTTTMVGSILTAAGLDPTVVVGGRIRGQRGNVRLGSGEWLVAEADEFDRSFLALAPEHAIVTNVEADHLDTYVDFDGVRAAFAEFLERVEEGGTIAVCVDDPEARRLPEPAGREIVGYGLDPRAEVRAESIEARGIETRFELILGEEDAGTVTLRMPGRHNVANALGAAAVARAIGVEPAAIRAGLENVRGVERRFEIVHEDEEITIVDDYAHHPTEVAATLASARESWPERRIVAVFQPHLYSRTRDFSDAFGAALTGADVVFVTDVYPAREDPIEGVTGELVSEAAGAAGAADATFLPDEADVGPIVARLAPGDVVITLGAGDVDAVARRLADARATSPAGSAEEDR